MSETNNREVHSGYLNRKVTINDNCGCTEGGFYEKEFTEHGFRGGIVQQRVIIYCETCDRKLGMFVK